MHRYDVTVTWTGDRGTGTSGDRDYDPDHDVSADGLPAVAASADPAFGGNLGRWNPRA